MDKNKWKEAVDDGPFDKIVQEAFVALRSLVTFLFVNIDLT